MADQKTAKYGNRVDGTVKGDGYFGPLKRPDGDVSTELSIGVDLGKGELQIPALVPTLSRAEVEHLLNDGPVTKEIAEKAIQYATARMKAGKPVFAQHDERYPLPADDDAEFQAGFNNVRKGPQQ